MPIIDSAIKTLRKDKKRHTVNQLTRNQLKKSVRLSVRTPSDAQLSAAFSAIDTAAKKHVIHKNKAARLKSRLAKKINSQSPKSQVKSKSEK